MKQTKNAGRKYFYALGQRARSRGITKEAGETYNRLDAAAPYARIYFDKGYRGLAL
jgi:hypothetical protein